MPSLPSGRRPGRFRGLSLALLPAAFLAAAGLETLAGCNRREAPGDPAVTKGKALYFTHCISCHGADPAKDGTLGPAVKGSSLDLLKARIIHGTYPPGYAPKRDTKIMRRLPLTEEDVARLHAFLNAP